MSITGRLFIKFMIAVLFIGLIAPFSILKGPDGNPIMSVASIMQDMELTWYEAKFKYQELKGDLLSTEFASINGVPETKTTKLYSWYDEQGTLSYGDTPHPTFGGEIMEVKSVMTIESYKPALPDEPKEIVQHTRSGNSDKTPDVSDSGFSLTTVPMDKIPELIQQAKDVQKLSNDRARVLDQF